MAIDFWKGPNGTAGSPTSGDFAAAANWSTGAAPNSETDASMAAGGYTATLDSAGVDVGSLTIGAGAELSLVNTTTFATLVCYDDSTNYGRVSIYGSAMYLRDGVSLANFGEITFVAANGYAAGFAGGTITNVGLISSGAGGYGQTISTVINDEAGTIRAFDGGTLDLSGTTTNHGLIEAAANSVVTTLAFNVLGTVTNLSGGTLTGGSWAANGDNSLLWLASSTISILGAGTTVTLSGANSQIRLDDGSGAPTYLEQTLDTVNVGATLEVLGGRDWTTSESLDVRGALHLGGGIFAPGDLRVERDATISGFGSVASQAIVDGLMKVDGGRTLEFTTLADFNGKITGGGTLELSGGSDTFTTSKVGVKHLLFDGANVEFDQNLKYAGELTVTTGTIELKDSVLTLAGKATIGAATIQSGPGGVLSVSGSLHATDGAAELSVRTLKVGGQVSVDHATLLVDGAVSGDGGFLVGSQGTLEFQAHSRLSGGPLVTLDGANARLVFDNLESGNARVASFDGKDKIDFAALDIAGARVGWGADADGVGGTLKVSNGTETATVHIEENHVRGDFVLKDDGAGGTLVTLKPVAGFGLVDAGAFGADAPGAGGHWFAAAHDLHAGVLA